VSPFSLDPGGCLGERTAVLILDDIVICQYIADDMKRQSDPDVLLLQAAADPTRLAILRQLSEEESVCACDFTATCDVSQPTVSHHLKVLREAGWVDSERRGTWIWYRIRPEAVERMRELVGGFAPGPARRVAGSARKLDVVQPIA
jgi:ArsR family transcriptional regulator